MSAPIYEIVDTTGDETYYTMGLYLSLDDAIEDIAGGPDKFGNPYERDESCTLEVRKRQLGWQPMLVGETVAKRSWVMQYPEDADAHWEEVK